jgi:opacity protein-like surface antigen
MKCLLATAALALSLATSAQAKEAIRPVTCVGELISAHTGIIGHCSFSGKIENYNSVYETCTDGISCHVEAEGIYNGHGMYIIRRVISVSATGGDF